MKKSILFSILTLLIIFQSCGEDQFTPKPKGYHKIDFPEKSYQNYDVDYCGLKFQYPTYAEIVRDTMFFDEKVENPCWLNINFPQFKGSVYLSHKEINDKNDFQKLLDDTHRLAFEHSVKADYIDELLITNKNGLGGIVYKVGGNAASPLQFYLTDSTSTFLRGSLYIQSRPNIDSLRPVINYLSADINVLLETLSLE